MKLFDFASATKLREDAIARLEAIRAELSHLEQRRLAVADAPAAPEDVITLVEEWLDRQAERGREVLRATLGPVARTAVRRPADVDKVLRLTAGDRTAGAVVDPATLDAILALVLREPLRETIAREIVAMAWPKSAMRAPDRAAELARLDRQINELTAERDGLHEQARAAGLRMN